MKIPFATAALCAVVATALPSASHAAPGDLDASFGGGDGKVTTDFANDFDHGRALAVQADGKIVVAGFAFNGDNSDFALARYTTDGALDVSFGGGDGIVSTNISPLPSDDYAYDVAVLIDGRILVAGQTTVGPASYFALARYTADGTLDPSFGGGDGKIFTDFSSGINIGYALAVQGDGKILVAGSASNGGTSTFALARYTADGTLDASFGGGDGMATTDFGSGINTGYALAVQGDGKILVAGITGNNGTNFDFALARYTTAGALDASFGGGDGMATTDFNAGYDGGYALAVQGDGKILVAGTTGNGVTSYFALARYTTAGTLDAGFGGAGGIVLTDFGSGTNTGYTLAVQGDGKILVAGSASNGGSDFALSRYTTNGALDKSFGGGDGLLITDFSTGNDVGYALAMQGDGNILVAGYSAKNGGNADFSLARYRGDDALALAAAPGVKVLGKKKLSTPKASVRLKGTTTGSVTSVAVKIGKKTVKAAGTASWSAKLKLKPGKNKIAIIATGPGGTSAPAKVTITRQ